MDKARFTDKVMDRLLIIHNTEIVKEPHQLHMKCFLIKVSIWFN